MMAHLLLLLIRLYQRVLSPLVGPVCRFEPSCSHYTASCIERFGALRGSGLGLLRVLRCNPLHPGGLDLPPTSLGESHGAPGRLLRSTACSHAHAASACAAPSSLRVRSPQSRP
jgi:putative membrane protein insertion efficiency factor